MTDHSQFMQIALRLARRGYGRVSPNPMVGAALVKQGKIIGQGWHRRPGDPHAEIEALRDARRRRRFSVNGATLYVTLEPCCTQGRTPPCTEALISAGLKQVIVGATDPNPSHSGKAYEILQRAGIAVTHGVLSDKCARLNEAFNHWIVHQTPFVTVKAAMTLDGKIATVSGQSKWIAGPAARAWAMRLRAGADAILVGVNTIIADDPSLTVRSLGFARKSLRRIVLDPRGRTPLASRVLRDDCARLTTLVLTEAAPAKRRLALQRHVRVVIAPARSGRIDLPWLAALLGGENVTSLLVEGGGETNAAWLPLAGRVAFFYAPMVLGGRSAPKGVAGDGAVNKSGKINLREIQWRRLGDDLLLTALAQPPE